MIAGFVGHGKLGTSPTGGIFSLNGERAIFASQSHLANVVANGHNVQTSSRFFTRIKMEIAAGKWKALAFVYANFRRNTTIGASESDAGLTAAHIVGVGMELMATPIGSPRGQTYPNTGGLCAPVTFGGDRGVRLEVGDVVVSDWILPSAFGLEFFEFTTRELYPWARTFFASPDRVAGIFLPSIMGPTSGAYFRGDRFAVPANDTDGLNLTVQSGNTSRITGTTFCSQPVPAPIAVIGIPADGQKAVMILGTSRCDSGSNFSDRGTAYSGNVGAGDGSQATDGPADTTYLDLPGAVCKWLQMPENSAPFFQIATGAGNMAVNWSTYTGGRPTTGIAYENPGGSRNDGHRFLMQFADVVINEHGVNDVGQIGIGGYTAADYKAQHAAISDHFKRVNPNGKYVPVFGPLSSFAGNTSAARDPASQTQANPNYTSTFRTLLQELVTEGKADRIWDWTDPAAVGSGLNLWSWGVDPTPLWTGVTRSGSTTLYVLLDGPETLLKRKEHAQQVVQVGSDFRFIEQNSGDEFKVPNGTPYAVAPGVGVPVTIFGNYSHDGLHPSGRGERRLANHANIVLRDLIKPIARPNTG